MTLVAGAVLGWTVSFSQANASWCGESAAQKGGEGISYFFEGANEFKSIAEGAECRNYFRVHARLELDPEQRLGNGVSWRVLVDVHTGMRMPRITWMVDHARLLRANAMFDAMHGARIAEGYKIEEDAHKQYKHRKAQARAVTRGEDKESPVDDFYFNFSEHFTQTDVELTYAGRRFVAYRESGFGPDDGRLQGAIFYDRDTVFDVDRGTAFGLGNCPGMDLEYGRSLFRKSSVIVQSGRIEMTNFTSRYFTFGDLLRICDDKRYADFHALVVEAAKAAAVKDVTVLPGENVPSIPWGLGAEAPMLPVLTLSGMALYPFSPRNAGFLDNEVYSDPIVIPYRALASLMTAGPLRDELLSLP